MKIGMFRKAFNIILLIQASMATILDVNKIKVAHVGKISIPTNSCEPFLNQYEALVSPNKEYMVVLNEEGKLLLLNKNYEILSEGKDEYKRELEPTRFFKGPYSLSLYNSKPGSIVALDRNNLISWRSDTYYRMGDRIGYGPFEAVLNDEGQFYIKDINLSSKLMDPTKEDIDENTFKSLCESRPKTKYEFREYYYNGERIKHGVCSNKDNDHLVEFTDFCVNTLNSTSRYRIDQYLNNEWYIEEECYHGKHPRELNYNPVEINGEEETFVMTFHLFADGTQSVIYYYNEYQIKYSDEIGCHNKIITEMDSTDNSVIGPGDRFYLKTDKAELSIDLTKGQFIYHYRALNAEKNDSGKYSILYDGVKFSYYVDYTIGIAELGEDGVFRIYDKEGKEVYKMGEPSQKKGHCTMKLEPTDAYLDDDKWGHNGVPLTHGLVITNASNEKFYFPPRKQTTKTTTITTTVFQAKPTLAEQ